ncbi:hypothetical protein BC830DRAFT_1133090 [Chytriomyces sp. MP71]|nr:hypothetical protein BC830DRAFT_1133090 [Chytriomyces sp. MP71]
MQDQQQFEDVLSDPTLAFFLDRRFSNPDSQYTISRFDMTPATTPQFDRRMSLPFMFAPQPQQLLAGDAASTMSSLFPSFEQVRSTHDYESQNQQLALQQQRQQPKFMSMGQHPLPVTTIQFSSFHNGFIDTNLTSAKTTSSSQHINFPPITPPAGETVSPSTPESTFTLPAQPTLLDQMKQSVSAAEAEEGSAPLPSLSTGKPAKFKPTEHQLSTLISVFEKNPFPSAALRTTLSEMLRIQPKQVRFWFQNRRATYKINGVHVLKPRKTKSGDVKVPVLVNGKDGQEVDLAPISSENPYFYVEKGRRVSVPVSL